MLRMILLLVAINCLVKKGMSAIEIIKGPANITVNEGDSAMFPCWYTGTENVPFWYIGGSVYTRRSLPSRHYYSNKTLIVDDVQVSDNGTEYQCSFSSNTAILTVIIPDPDPEVQAVCYGVGTEHAGKLYLPIHGQENARGTTLMATTMSNSTFDFDVTLPEIDSSTEIASSTFVSEVTLPELDSSDGNTEATGSDVTTVDGELPSYKIIPAVICGGVFITCIILTLSLLIICGSRRAHKHAGGATQEDTEAAATYEEVKDVVDTHHKGFKIEVNACYVVTRKQANEPVYAEIEELKLSHN